MIEEDSGFPTVASHARTPSRVPARESHARHEQTSSSAITWISRRGAGNVRFPSDLLKLSGTVTKAQYDRAFEKTFGKT